MLTVAKGRADVHQFYPVSIFEAVKTIFTRIVEGHVGLALVVESVCNLYFELKLKGREVLLFKQLDLLLKVCLHLLRVVIEVFHGFIQLVALL